MLKRHLVAGGVSLALLVPVAASHTTQATPQISPQTVALVKVALHTKVIPPAVKPSPYRALAKRFPGHSLPYYHRLTRFFVLLRQDALRRWYEAISFPPMELRPVIQCVKDHESGNYSESTHPGSGSGAYQYVPGTWRTWFLKWRDSLPANSEWKNSYFAFAYQAPAYVQDHVFVYTLQNGGASNWHPRYGDDPCTLGLQ